MDERQHLGDLGIDESMILQCIGYEQWTGIGQGPRAGCYDHVTEPSGSIKVGISFTNGTTTVSLSRSVGLMKRINQFLQLSVQS
jgi:hypothetical protein